MKMTEEPAESEGIEPLDNAVSFKESVHDSLRRISSSLRSMEGHSLLLFFCTVLGFGAAQTQNKVNSTV